MRVDAFLGPQFVDTRHRPGDGLHVPVTMNLDGVRIAVVGGGVGGLAAGAAAAQKGAWVTIFETTPGHLESGSGLGIQISPNGTRVLRAIGCSLEFSARSMHARSLSLKDGLTGRGIARLDIQARHDDARYCLARRSDLVASLADCARRHGATLLAGTRADVSLRGDRFEVLTDAHLAVPDDFGIVIAADGIHSEIRQKHLDGGKPATDSGQRAWRALTPTSSASERMRSDLSGGPCLFAGPGMHLVAYLVPGGPMINVVAITRNTDRMGNPANRSQPEQDRKELRTLFSGWCDSVVSVLDTIHEPETRDLHHGPAPAAWSRANLVAIGDAAHPMLPHLAQGASAGLEDAWTLIEALARARSLPAALATYERVRRSRIVRLQRASERSGRIYQARSPAVRLPVHFGLHAAGRLLPSALRYWYGWIHDHDVVAGAIRN